MVTKNEFICSFLDYKMALDLDDFAEKANDYIVWKAGEVEDEPEEESWFDLESDRQDDNPNQK